MENLSIKGTIKKIYPTQQINDTFKKREFILLTDDKYPQTIKFELTQEKTELLDYIKKQITATVYFNVRGRDWTNKENKTVYFVSLNAWKIETETTPEIKPIPEPIKQETQPQTQTDDLPF
jgi:hypothetical protein